VTGNAVTVPITITVVVPTFNRKHCLPRALDSIFAQTEPVDEVVVVDDGSDDGTEARVREHYPEVVYLAQSNRGVSAARNTGIAAANHPWIGFLDSDDAWLPDKIARQKNALREDPAVRVCHGEEIWIRNGRRVNAPRQYAKSGGWIFPKCLPLCVISPSSVMIHRQVFDAAGVFDESLPACEDYDLWLRVCSRFPVLFVSHPVLEKYGGHPDQLSRQWGLDRFRIRALEKIINSASLSPQNDSLARQTLRGKCRIFAAGAEKRGRSQVAADFLARAAQY
jgi:glycosyltransferase involved in cell wall biosynthesis